MNSNRNLRDEKRLQSLIKKAVAEEFDVRKKPNNKRKIAKTKEKPQNLNIFIAQ